MNDTIPLKFRLVAAGLHLINALIPFLSTFVIGMLWLIIKDIHPFLDRSSRNALNCALNTLLGTIAFAAFCMFVFSITCGVGNQDPSAVIASLILLSFVMFSYSIYSVVVAIFALSGSHFESRLIYPFIRST
jgi:uncharacterized Tic20 family protein